MVTFQKPSHEKNTGITLPGNENTDRGNDNKENIKGFLRLSINNPAILVLKYNGIEAKTVGDVVQKAEKQPLSEKTVHEKMKKTGNTPFQFEEFQLEMDADSFLPVGALNQLRRRGIDTLYAAVLEQYRRMMPEYTPDAVGDIPEGITKNGVADISGEGAESFRYMS